MAKYCSICGKKIGFGYSSGYGLSLEGHVYPICSECNQNLETLRRHDNERDIEYSSKYLFQMMSKSVQHPEAIYKYVNQLIESANSVNGVQTSKENLQSYIELEKKKQQYAIEHTGKFEYKIETVTDINGATDERSVQDVLDRYANRGWRLKSMGVNDLGTDALRILGAGVNSNVSQVVLIFERIIES